MPNKKNAEKASSLIVSRVQREAAEGKGETRNTVIRSRVIHGDVGESAPKAARKSARKSTRSTSAALRTKRSRASRTVPTPDTPET